MSDQAPEDGAAAVSSDPGGEGASPPAAAGASGAGDRPGAAAPPSGEGRGPDGYPPWASTREQRRRWDYALEAARQLFADDGILGPGPTPGTERDVQQAARVIYRSDIPTGDPPEAVRAGHPLARPPAGAEQTG